MRERPADAGEETGEHFTYFMIRIHRRRAGAAEGPSGVIERLGSGRKRAFTGAAELLDLLAEWSGGLHNMPAEEQMRNQRDGRE